jgi:hypothetical protein
MILMVSIIFTFFFNQDIVGFPQNEETVTVCGFQPNVVLGGTNDYRGMLDSQQNFTGWHLSLDGGSSLANEGLLPPVEIAGSPVPSGGDPVKASDDNCNLYAASLNYDPLDPFGQPNGIGVYRSEPETLAFCLGGSDPSCWPTRRAVAQSARPWRSSGSGSTRCIGMHASACVRLCVRWGKWHE